MPRPDPVSDRVFRLQHPWSPDGGQNLPKVSDLIPHRPPFLLLKDDYEYWITTRDPEPDDKVVVPMDVAAAHSLCGNGHFPNDPIIPGVYIAEAMQQAAAMLTLFIDRLNFEDKSSWVPPVVVVRDIDISFDCPVRPTDVVMIEVVMDERKRVSARYHGISRVGDDVVCTLHRLRGMIAQR